MMSRRGGSWGLWGLGAIGAAAAIAACSSSNGGDVGSGTGAATPAERAVIGAGTDYQVPPGQDGVALAATLSADMKARRKFAWDVVSRAFAPVQIPDAPQLQFAIPTVLTWYEQREIQTIFDDIIAQKGGAKAGVPKISEADVDASMARLAAGKTRGARPADSFRQTLIQQSAASQSTVNALGGTGFTLFSPEYVRHVLSNYQAIAKCAITSSDAATMLAKPPFDPVVDATNFSSPCLAAEFPPNAVMAKMVWRQIGTDAQPEPIETFDTTETGLGKIFSDIHGKWELAKSGTATTKATDIFTSQDTSGTTWGLVAMHLTTKETRDWVWSTYWWAPNDSDSVHSANGDFGADRDVSGFQTPELREQFDNYKMCATVDFAEGDDLAARYQAELADPSDPQNGLARALLAADKFVNAPPSGGDYRNLTGSAPRSTWCSNPQVETHPGNAHTNCIGCHQNSATGVTFSDTFYMDTSKESEWPSFPKYGTARVRQTFPSDFSWGYEFEVKANIERVLAHYKITL